MVTPDTRRRWTPVIGWAICAVVAGVLLVAASTVDTGCRDARLAWATFFGVEALLAGTALTLSVVAIRRNQRWWPLLGLLALASAAAVVMALLLAFLSAVIPSDIDGACANASVATAMGDAGAES